MCQDDKLSILLKIRSIYSHSSTKNDVAIKRTVFFIELQENLYSSQAAEILKYSCYCHCFENVASWNVKEDRKFATYVKYVSDNAKIFSKYFSSIMFGKTTVLLNQLQRLVGYN